MVCCLVEENMRLKIFILLMIAPNVICANFFSSNLMAFLTYTDHKKPAFISSAFSPEQSRFLFRFGIPSLAAAIVLGEDPLRPHVKKMRPKITREEEERNQFNYQKAVNHSLVKSTRDHILEQAKFFYNYVLITEQAALKPRDLRKEIGLPISFWYNHWDDVVVIEDDVTHKNVRCKIEKSGIKLSYYDNKKLENAGQWKKATASRKKCKPLVEQSIKLVQHDSGGSAKSDLFLNNLNKDKILHLIK